MASRDRFGVEEGVVYSNHRATWQIRDGVLIVQMDGKEKRVVLNGRQVENYGHHFLAISGESWETVDIFETW